MPSVMYVTSVSITGMIADIGNGVPTGVSRRPGIARFRSKRSGDDVVEWSGVVGGDHWPESALTHLRR